MAEGYNIKEEAADEIVAKLAEKESDLTSITTEIASLKTNIAGETNELLETALNLLTTEQFLNVLNVFCKKDGAEAGIKVRKSREELKNLGGPMLSLIHQEIIKRFGGIKLLGGDGVDAVAGTNSRNAMEILQRKLDYKNAAENTSNSEPDGVLGPITLGLVEAKMKEDGFNTLLSSETANQSLKLKEGVGVIGEVPEEQKKLNTLAVTHISTLRSATFNTIDQSISTSDGTVYKPMELNPRGPDQYYSFNDNGDIILQYFDGNGNEFKREVKYKNGDLLYAEFQNGQWIGKETFEQNKAGNQAHSEYNGEMSMNDKVLVREGNGTYTNANLQKFYGTWGNGKLEVNGIKISYETLNELTVGNVINQNGSDIENPEFTNKVAELQELQRIENLKKEYMGDTMGFSIDESAKDFPIHLFSDDQKDFYKNNEFTGGETAYNNMLKDGIPIVRGNIDGTYERTVLTNNPNAKEFNGTLGEHKEKFHDTVNQLTYAQDPERRFAKVEKDGEPYRLNLLPQRDTINGKSVFLGFKVNASKVETV